MNAHCRFAPYFLFTALLAMPIAPRVALADHGWEDRWEDYREELEERREEYEERLEDRRSALEEFWGIHREAQRETTRRHYHAWYGYYGPYYGSRVAQNYRTYGPREFFAPALQPGCYGDALGAPCHDHGCGPVGLGCHGDLHGGSPSFGSIRACWQ
jgi:hypothetical protein